MKLNELKCKNCGANLKIKKGDESVTCPYCNNTYTIDYSNTSDSSNNSTTYNFSDFKIHNKNIIIFYVIVMFLVSFIMISIIISAVSSTRNRMGGMTNKTNLNTEIWSFNCRYNNGTHFGGYIGTELDEVITSNKTNKNRLITVVYQGNSTTEPNEILKIKQQLQEFNEYEVILDYDDDGFITTFTIE